MSIPDFIKNETTGLHKHEKSFDSILGKEKITIYVPERFKVNDTYWNQFIPDNKLQAASITKGERNYKYVGKEIIHISYDLEPRIEQRPDVRKISACPHPNCVYCLQIKKIKTHFENGIYRTINVGDYFSFSANANLIQATLWVEQGKAQIHAYEGNRVFMKSDIINADNPASVSSFGRRTLRTIKIYAIPDESEVENNNFTRLWVHLSRYNIESWP